MIFFPRYGKIDERFGIYSGAKPGRFAALAANRRAMSKASRRQNFGVAGDPVQR
jgi:hypothetical protein